MSVKATARHTLAPFTSSYCCTEDNQSRFDVGRPNARYEFQPVKADHQVGRSRGCCCRRTLNKTHRHRHVRPCNTALKQKKPCQLRKFHIKNTQQQRNCCRIKSRRQREQYEVSNESIHHRIYSVLTVPPTEDPRKEVGVDRVYASTMGHETAKAIIPTAAPRAGTAGAWNRSGSELFGTSCRVGFRRGGRRKIQRLNVKWKQLRQQCCAPKG